MKRVLNVGIGGRSFIIDEDAYQKLDLYLERFRQKTGMGSQTKEVMDELEMRIADLFSESLLSKQEVVNIALVNKVIAQLGMPDGSYNDGDYRSQYYQEPAKPVKKFYRDSDSKAIGGVCAGISAHFDIDLVIVRILFVIAFLFGSLGFWVYVIFWIIAPLAVTPAQKCELRGLPVTAENMRRFSSAK